MARVISFFTNKVNTYFLTFFTFHLLAPSPETAEQSSRKKNGSRAYSGTTTPTRRGADKHGYLENDEVRMSKDEGRDCPLNTRIDAKNSGGRRIQTFRCLSCVPWADLLFGAKKAADERNVANNRRFVFWTSSRITPPTPLFARHRRSRWW